MGSESETTAATPEAKFETPDPAQDASLKYERPVLPEVHSADDQDPTPRPVKTEDSTTREPPAEPLAEPDAKRSGTSTVVTAADEDKRDDLNVSMHLEMSFPPGEQAAHEPIDIPVNPVVLISAPDTLDDVGTELNPELAGRVDVPAPDHSMPTTVSLQSVSSMTLADAEMLDAELDLSEPPMHENGEMLNEITPLHPAVFHKRKRSDSGQPDDQENGASESNGNTRSIIQTVVRTPAPVIPPQLTYVPLKTGLCYDVRMRYHSRIVTSPYDYVDPHPEDPRRIYRVYKAIAEAGLITDPELAGVEDLGPLIKKIPIREATDDEILAVHTKEHLDFIESTTTMPRERLIEETEKGDSIYLNNDSYLAAKLSCGGTIEACRAVIENEVKNSIAIVRPPGHHAEPYAPGGFCLFSNVAVAAKVMLQRYPESVRRILILDWDVHHGNGTQRAFLDDDRVLYVSLHRYENARFYPGTDFGSHTVVGEGAGKGYSLNIPWSVPGMSDGDYLYAFNKVIMPVALEYDPDLVIISAGFDAADGDLLGGCHVSPAGYSQMTHMLKSLSNGNVVVALEGGYSLSAIAASALAVTKVLLGEPPGVPRTKLPCASVIRVIDDVIKVHSQYWQCFKPELAVANLGEADKHERLAQAINYSGQKKLIALHGFTPLPILNESAPQIVYDCQILASPDVHKAEKLIVIIHEVADIWADRDPILGSINANKSLVVEPTAKFLEWGLKSGFAVVDICVPGETDIWDDSGYSTIAGSQEVCTYLWDNYIDYYDAKNIVFVGSGDAYAGIVHLVGHRDLRERTDAILCFIGNISLKAITPVIDEYMTEWFYRTSLVFTSHDHPAWDVRVNPKRPRKKFGRVLRSDSQSLPLIVEERFQEAIEFVEESLEGEEGD